MPGGIRFRCIGLQMFNEELLRHCDSGQQTFSVSCRLQFLVRALSLFVHHLYAALLGKALDSFGESEIVELLHELHGITVSTAAVAGERAASLADGKRGCPLRMERTAAPV